MDTENTCDLADAVCSAASTLMDRYVLDYGEPGEDEKDQIYARALEWHMAAVAIAEEA